MGISNRQDDFVDTILKQICDAGVRIEKDIRNEKVGYKIREYTLKKVPFMIVVGDKEMEAGTISVRTREGVDLGTMPAAEFVQKVQTLCKQYK